MDEPWKLCAKFKEPDIKGHISYDFIHMKCPEGANRGQIKRLKVD